MWVKEVCTTGMQNKVGERNRTRVFMGASVGAAAAITVVRKEKGRWIKNRFKLDRIWKDYKTKGVRVMIGRGKVVKERAWGC